MPELPEVETIRIGLETAIVGKTIEDIEIRLPKQFIGDPKAIIGAEIVNVRRYGKGLVIDLNNGYSLAIHVKMTGQLLLRQQLSTEDKERRTIEIVLPDRYTHVIFKLKTKSEKLKINENEDVYLFFRDIRQFGWVRVVKTSKIGELPFFRTLGLEPLKDLTLEKFSKVVKTSKTPIKLLLMDQTKIAGIGNIYANDALFEAGIHPKRSAQSLHTSEIKVLFYAIESVLKKSIAAGGASANNYVNAFGEKGTYQEQFLVYKKDGQKCKRCGFEIKKMKLGGRGTFYCPDCQK